MSEVAAAGSERRSSIPNTERVSLNHLSSVDWDSADLKLTEYFLSQRRRDKFYRGQLTPAFQNALLRHHSDLKLEDCDFYHTMNLPDGRVLSGEWDLRGHEARYLGVSALGENYFAGKRVAEIGPASGALTAFLAGQANDVVVFDLPFGNGPELVPFPQIDLSEAHRSGAISAERLRNSWWYGKSALHYRASAIYVDLYDLPDDIGRFSSAVFGCILLHLSNPFRALQQLASKVDDSIIVTEVDSASGHAAMASNDLDYPAIAAFNEGPLPSGLVHWWSFTPQVIVKMLERLGFEAVEVDRHVPPNMAAHAKLFTVVGRRRRSIEIGGGLRTDSDGSNVSAGISLPPTEQRVLVSGTDQIKEYMRLGEAGFQSIKNSLKKAGIQVENAGRVLDFGCGVGRVLRYWAEFPATEVYGCDYRPAAIAWCAENMPFGRFAVNSLVPELPYVDDFFEVIYALSVFTHLPAAEQLPWFAELLRILKPGGVIYFTVHGQFYEDLLDPASKAKFSSGEVVVSGEDQPGTNVCAAFHPKQYVQHEFVENFGLDLVEHIECGALGNPKQDSYLVRKRGGTTNAA